MREWILQNTKIASNEYDSLINPTTITIEGISKDVTTLPLTNHPLININLFTLEVPTPEREKEFNIQIAENGYIYQNIKFNILAELLPSLKDILYSQARLGTCFDINHKICLMTPNSRIITAICKDIYHEPSEPFLHTFIIITIPNNNEEYVLDGTMNTIIKKEDYLDIFEAQIISDISRKEFISTIKLFSKLKIDDEISLIEYFCFPEETTNAVKKLTRTQK